MFKDAKIKLTSWYLLIIMTITLSFSTLVYTGVLNATARALEAQRQRQERRLIEFEEFQPKNPRNPKNMPLLDEETLFEIRSRTLQILILVNFAILLISGYLSYFLAGKTLAPIEEMVKKQKRFVSDAAHDLKTPLTAMKAELEVTLREKNPSVSTLKDTLASSVEEIDKLNLFINRLLTNSKYQNTENNLAFSVVQLDNLLHDVVKKFNSLAVKNSQKIETNFIPLSVSGNADSLIELFSNLLDNSIKYGKTNGTIKLILSQVDKLALVEVSDDGVGISEEDITNIFEPFYRAEKSRSKGIKSGFGLGLSISKEIVQNHGGKIDVESNLGKGTLFKVLLPLANAPITNHSEENAGKDISQDSLRKDA